MRLRVVITVAAGLLLAPAAQAAPDPEIAALQVALRSKGMYFSTIDGTPGPLTANGLRTFQRLAGLPVTGELSPRTRADLGALGRPLLSRRVLKQDDYGWDVSALQFLLARAGHLRLLDVDGHFGISTRKALTRFQGSRGLGADGVAGPATMTAFGSGKRSPVLTRATAAPVSYRVRAGDTLAAIADKHGTTVGAVAATNGLHADGLLLAGATLKLPAARAVRTLSGSTVRSQIDHWAGQYGVPATLARALAWQESGFQVDVTSSVGAWGPMQVMPATWDFVETVLLGQDVPRTGEGGVQVGMAYLRHLLKRFDGDQRLALAAWYQGEKAVRERGFYDETKVFVANVLALTGRQF
jgi:peptidoglycan hydrolase-like protein with peptidoglycan-binding domain